MLGSSTYTCLVVGLRVGLEDPKLPQGAPGVMATECAVLEACLLKDC